MPLGHDLTLLQDNDLVSQVQEVDTVRDQDSRLFFEDALDHLLEDFLADVCIESRDRVIHKDNVAVAIDGSGQAESGFLAS